jgi:hypothetical protein
MILLKGMTDDPLWGSRKTLPKEVLEEVVELMTQKGTIYLPVQP